MNKPTLPVWEVQGKKQYNILAASMVNLEDEGLVHPLEEKFGQKKFIPFFFQMWLNKPDIPKVMKTHFK